MKLRNKKTGMIGEIGYLAVENNITDQEEWFTYNTLKELNEEWEDYEEPKEYWCIDWTGGVKHIVPLDDSTDEYEKNKKEIGNYFETVEEAEKAVEKLKAWKRLKDKGFRFYKKWDSKEPEGSFYYVEIHGKIDPVPTDVEFMKALDLLFGGEE